MSEKLVLKSINELLGENFYIPYYQRGYRWTAQQVFDLLDDIGAFAKNKAEGQTFYCLQPIVIKEKEWDGISGWEVVDGQQRLTTIYIILSYLMKEFLKTDSLIEDYHKEIFTIQYETRPGSEALLKNITDDSSNIDFYHMSEAYKNVKQWFTSGENVKDRTDRNTFLSAFLGKEEDKLSVRIIWYHVDQQVDSLELFTRLNIG
jgi:uncharacterized protein with ParB-like and HNH nuclease domain